MLDLPMPTSSSHPRPQGYPVFLNVIGSRVCKSLQTRNFQKFLSDDGNESLQYNPPLPPSLDSTYKDP